MMRTLLVVTLLLMAACTPNPPPIEASREYFQMHTRELEALVRLGQANPALRRVQLSTRKRENYYGKPSASDLAAQQQAYDMLEALGLDFVVYHRLGGTPGLPLIAVTFPMYRWGLSFGGYLVTITFYPEYGINPPTNTLPKWKATELSKGGWYVVESDTR